ncbi:DNA-directed RNA polymerase III subunit RPC7 isoform X1 [Numida meleagris]|uniref:DNA-directed RNA polymerase III subunit RPC7 isoform X1 n=1 Tax=Numida meleagris TaxID=8996 RepID=UPI000B3E23CD|nr:DNA-directed RNA polymerase III subunit RPC7 isoform X1 [Numida meleagris]XP_021235534.1 DNA-directed RNA polymerase III subunit RPC7 isoform X1 [Numida meleagris]
MAGSGRGRGRASFTFNIEAIGFSKGAVLPDVVCKPPPLFPSTDNKPVPLKTGEDEDYMLALKQDFRGAMKKMPYFLAVEEDREAIERYSKKYMDGEKEHAAWTPDWRRLPREMKPKKKMKKAGSKPKKAKNSEPKSNLDVLKKIEELEKKDDEEEKSDDEKDRTKDKEGEDDEEAEEPEEYDEEEHEEVFYLFFCLHRIRSQSLSSVLAVSQRNVPSFSEAEGEL